MKHRNHDQRRFIWGVGDDVVAYRLEPQRSRGKIRSLVTLMRESHKFSKGGQDFLSHTRGSKRIILSNEFPYVVDVLRRARVEIKTLPGIHFKERFLIESSSRWRRVSKKASPSTGFTRPLLMSS